MCLILEYYIKQLQQLMQFVQEFVVSVRNSRANRHYTLLLLLYIYAVLPREQSHKADSLSLDPGVRWLY